MNRFLFGVALNCTAAALSAQTTSLNRWVRPDTAARSVTIELTAVHTAGAAGRQAGTPAATMNGIANGAVQVVVPLGWTVVIEWRNGDSTTAHSFIVQQEREKLPERAGEPAFLYAYSRTPVAGMGPGRSDRTQFVVDQAGWFWILCGVPEHAIEGEYISLKVDRDATVAAVVRQSAAPRSP